MAVKEIIDKLSSYNLFNYLFPGAVFAILLSETTDFAGSLNLDLATVIIVYFTGLVISRFGSLVIEEVLLKMHFCKLIDTKLLFKKFRGNIKLEIIHEAMNMYRTLAAMSLLLSIMTVADMIINETITLNGFLYSFFEIIIFLLFTFAYLKQRDKVLQCL